MLSKAAVLIETFDKPSSHRFIPDTVRATAKRGAKKNCLPVMQDQTGPSGGIKADVVNMLKTET